MLKQGLKQKQLQKLSPQQIQLMKLLQVPTVSLDQRIKEEMEENPALETGESQVDIENNAENNDDKSSEDLLNDIDLTAYLSDDENQEHRYYVNNSSSDDEQKTIPIAVAESFHSFLEQQMGLVDFENDHQEQLAFQLLGSIDDDGYLRRPLDAIIDDLAFQRNIITNEAELELVLKIIQGFEPLGVGARSLQECLLIQLKTKLIKEPNNVNIVNAEKILTQAFDAFSKKHYNKLVSKFKLQKEQLKDAIEEVLKLNPKPGSAFGGKSKSTQYIIPDFSIVNNEGKLELSLNSKNVPDLRVSDYFVDMMKTYKKGSKDTKQKETVLFIKQKIDSAKWFIDAIKQRQETMYKVMRTILHYQYQFFLSGDKTDLRPMILKDIAEISELDISTISRVTNSKFVETEFGTFKLKDFFSESLTTADGEEVSTIEVKKILSDLIDSENKSKPLSDQNLTKALVEKGYNIARRTVAKYRESLGIPVARLRKTLD